MSFVFADRFFLQTHATPLIVQVFVLALREAGCVIVFQELLRDRSLLLLLGQSVANAPDSITINDSTDLEVLGKLLVV